MSLTFLKNCVKVRSRYFGFNFWYVLYLGEFLRVLHCFIILMWRYMFIESFNNSTLSIKFGSCLYGCSWDPVIPPLVRCAHWLYLHPIATHSSAKFLLVWDCHVLLLDIKSLFWAPNLAVVSLRSMCAAGGKPELRDPVVHYSGHGFR